MIGLARTLIRWFQLSTFLTALFTLAACAQAAPTVAPPATSTPVPVAAATLEPTTTRTPTATETVAPTATSTSTPAATATSEPTSPPTVEPVATATPEDTQSTPAASSMPFLPGKYFHQGSQRLHFIWTENGRFTHRDGDVKLAEGTYRIEGDTYIQTSLWAPVPISGCPVPMSYKYSFDGKHLTFRPDRSRHDPCETRKSLYTQTTFELAGD